MGFKSNWKDDVKPAVIELGQTWNPRHRLRGARRLGDEIADAVATEIRLRTRYGQADPDGNPLAPLRPSTIRKKLKGGFPTGIGVETGQMLEQDELRGRVYINDTTIVMTYGQGGDTEDKAERFQEGRPGVQEPRPFYELGADGEKVVDDLIDEASEIARQEFER